MKLKTKAEFIDPKQFTSFIKHREEIFDSKHVNIPVEQGH